MPIADDANPISWGVPLGASVPLPWDRVASGGSRERHAVLAIFSNWLTKVRADSLFEAHLRDGARYRYEIQFVTTPRNVPQPCRSITYFIETRW